MLDLGTSLGPGAWITESGHCRFASRAVNNHSQRPAIVLKVIDTCKQSREFRLIGNGKTKHT